MKLYMFQVAPNPTRVRLYIAEKAAAGTQMPIEEVSLNLPKGEHRSEEHLARNPLGNLPVLELDDGSFLTESLAIIEYLEECFPTPPMIGVEPKARAQTRRLERLCETSVLAPLAQVVHATQSPLGLPASPEVAERFSKSLETGLRVVDEILSDGRPFVAGATVTHADCTLQAALQFGRFGRVEIAPGFKNLHRWDAAYRERAAAKKVLVV